MNKKILLSLFGVIALGASCTNEVEEFAQQTTNGKGFKVNIQVTDEKENTRIAWDGTSTKWENLDQFSLFNVGGSVDYLKATANAAYKTVDGGANFTSENVLFEGDHLLVYPLNKDYTSSANYITVAPGNDGDKNLGANSIFLGSKILTITKGGEKQNGVTDNDAGYQKNVVVSVRPANAGVFFNLIDAKSLPLEEGDQPVKINSVELVADGTPLDVYVIVLVGFVCFVFYTQTSCIKCNWIHTGPQSN